jgi:class 3 adenylate cyclase/tetratricopeptide (TPR) repeat protein
VRIVSATTACSRCGFENEHDADFCRSCGVPLGAPQPSPAGETRKVVTVLFSDVAGSTRLGEQLDPEAFRGLMSRYFGAMESVLTRHGAVVEKFIGDAVMAVFGVPRVHEDDALRAVRAAAEMRETLRGLNVEFERSLDVTLSIRTGIQTGDVVAGDPDGGQAFVAGDAVNVAARLEQMAAPGEILVGDATYRLVRDAVRAEALGPRPVEGREKTTTAWRLLEVVPGAPGWTRRLDSPLVGREGELVALRETFEQTTARPEAALVTLMGPAGIGKSRLTQEFLALLGDRCSVVAGRCLPYGEGMTFWPIVTALKDAAQIGERDAPVEARDKLFELLPAGDDRAVVGDRLAALLGLAPAMPGIQETFWAVRKLVEELAARRPLALVFDDIQWGEATFLDLLEYLADRLRETPVLIVCLARPELLDVRPGWSRGQPNARIIALEALDEDETKDLIRHLLGPNEVATGALKRIAETAEGNPLFVEETLRMLADDGLLRPGQAGWRIDDDISSTPIPPTIQALLSARLERLDAEERIVIERAAVVGRIFWWGAVAELTPPQVRQRLSTHLQALVGKELLRPEISSGPEDAYRFTHILIRDAAYEGLPKGVRADLHERLADWLELDVRGRTGEYEEIVGYHLEKAHSLLLELGTKTEHIGFLGSRAGLVLASAGRRAFARGDMPAAVNLLSRAAALSPADDPARIELLLQLGFALLEIGDYARLEDVLADAVAAASAAGDPDLEAHAVILALRARMDTAPEGWAAHAESEASRAIETFRELSDDSGLADGWALLGLVHVMNARFGPAEEAWEQAALHAARAGKPRNEFEALAWLPLLVWAGPTPVERGIERCVELRERSRGDRKASSSALMAQAAFEAALGRGSEARELLAHARALLEEVALTVWLAGPLAQFAGWTELLAGDPSAAERELRWGYEKLTEIGESSWLSTVAAILAEAVYEQGRDDEAEALTRASEASAAAEDLYSQALLRSVRGKVMARGGEHDDAQRLVSDAVGLANATDFLHLRWRVRLNAAEALDLMGLRREAEQAAADAIAIAREKGITVGAHSAPR